jgi:protein TonB
MVISKLSNRAYFLALFISVLVHVAVAGLIYLLQQTDAQQASSTAPQVKLEVILEQPETQAAAVADSKPPESTPPQLESVPRQQAARPKPEKKKPVVPEQVVPDSSPRQQQLQRRQRIASSPTRAPQVSKTAHDVSQLMQADYFSRLQAHIESHKYYPRAARKQGITGVVEVEFQLDERAQVSRIQCSGGHRLLRHAAQRAIDRASPLPEPPAELSLPIDIRFTMHYTLKH